MARKRVKGYTDFGGIALPVLPQHTVFTDRDDGTLWYLGHSSDGLRISLNDATVSGEYKRVFAAYDEPFAENNPRIRIFVRGGRIGYEIIELEQGVTDKDTMRLVSRRGNENVTRALQVASSFSEANIGALGVLAWEDSVE